VKDSGAHQGSNLEKSTMNGIVAQSRLISAHVQWRFGQALQETGGKGRCAAGANEGHQSPCSQQAGICVTRAAIGSDGGCELRKRPL
jgi:hypothetical protein